MILSDLLGDHGPGPLPLPGSAHGRSWDLLHYAKRSFVRKGWVVAHLNTEAQKQFRRNMYFLFDTTRRCPLISKLTGNFAGVVISGRSEND